MTEKINLEEYINQIHKDFLIVTKEKELESNYYFQAYQNQFSNKVNVYINSDNISEIVNYVTRTGCRRMNILDLGCGIGDKSVLLKRCFPRSKIFGVETKNNDDPQHKLHPPYKFFEQFYDFFADKYNINYSLYGGRNLDIPKNYFDIILLYAVIEHINPKKRCAFIESISHKLKKGGHIIITRCPRYLSFTEFISRLFKLRAHEWTLKKSELISLFNKETFVIELIKNKTNIPLNPRIITNNFTPLLIFIDKFLSFLRWPFSSDYFLIAKKIRD